MVKIIRKISKNVLEIICKIEKTQSTTLSTTDNDRKLNAAELLVQMNYFRTHWHHIKNLNFLYEKLHKTSGEYSEIHIVWSCPVTKVLKNYKSACSIYGVFKDPVLKRLYIFTDMFGVAAMAAWPFIDMLDVAAMAAWWCTDRASETWSQLAGSCVSHFKGNEMVAQLLVSIRAIST